MTDMLDVIGLFRHAFAASLLIGVVCGLLGVHVVARRMIAAGLALPQVAGLGIAVGLLASDHPGSDHASHALEEPHAHAAAIVLVLAASGLLAWPAATRSIGRPAIAGLLFAGSGALTILLMARSALGMEEVHHLVEGNILAVSDADLRRLLVALVPVLVVLVLGTRRLVFCTVDAEMAATLGIRVRMWEALFFVSFAVTAAVAVHAAGTLFVFSFLVLPGAAGVLLGRSGAATLSVAAGVALLASAAGFAASASSWDTPTGPTCAAFALVLFLVCAAAAGLRARFGRDRADVQR